MFILTLLACSTSPAPTPPTPPTPAPPPTLDPIALGLAIPSRVHAIGWLAEDLELFGRQPVTVSTMGGSAATLRGLVANTIQLGLAGGDALTKANRAGADLVVLAGFVNHHHHRLVVRKDVTDASELKGQAVGLPFLGGPQDTALKVALRRLDLTYGTDVEVRNLGKEFNRLAALDRGDIAGTLSALPTTQLEARGLRVLVDLPALDEPFPYAMLIADRAWLAAHEDSARAVLTGLCDATERYRSDAGSRKLVDARLLPASDEEAVAQHASTGPTQLSWPPVPDPAAFQTVYDVLDGAPPNRAPLDLTLLDELRDAGRCGGR